MNYETLKADKAKQLSRLQEYLLLVKQMKKERTKP